MAEITKIEKLNGRNYQSWKYNVKLVLMERGLWGFTQEGKEQPPEETATDTVKRSFQLRSDKAYSLIALSVEKHLQIHISSTTEPLKAWQNLQKQFEFVSITQIVRLNRKFYAASMQEGADLMKHLTHMTSLAEQLRELKEDISPKKFATVVLGSLPDSYDNFLTSLNARDAQELEWDNIKGLLIEEYMKRKEKNDSNKVDNAMYTKRPATSSRGRGRRTDHQHGSRKWQQNYTPAWGNQPESPGPRGDREKDGIVCFKCKQAGHIVRNCPLNNNRNYKGEQSHLVEEGKHIALISTMEPNDKWFIDSAATKHMTHNKNLLMDYIEYDTPTEIYLGDNTVIHAEGEGMVKLFTGGDTGCYLDLHKVLYVPKLAKNLLSVPIMASMEAEVHFDKEKCIVSKDGKNFVIGKLVNGTLYTVNAIEFAQPSTANEETAEIWHQRLGHLNHNYVDQMKKKDMVTGMNCNLNSNSKRECEGCTLGKMNRNPFPKKSQGRATKPYEVIHSDVCGPMQIDSKGGSKYMVTFIDDYSRYVTVYFIKNKSEVLTKFKEYVTYVENQGGNQGNVKLLRTDNGGEYTSNDFVKYCAEKGISHQFTNPYCPEQNGVAERLNRTIMEATRSMIYQAGVPLDFWAEACNTAIYLHNRSPTIAVKDKTPYECLFGTKPDISHLRVFGCMCYVHVPDSRRRKLDQKANRAIFVGYPRGTKGYKLYDLEKKRFVISRDVTFFEKNFHQFESKLDSAKQLDDLIISDDDEEVERLPAPDREVNDHGINHNVPEIPDEEMNERVEENGERENQQQVPENENVERVGENDRVPNVRTYEDLFMENVRNLGPVRQRRVPSRFRDVASPAMESLTSEIDEPRGVQDALNSEHANEWKDAMISEYSSLMENETWELVPPPEGQNVVGSRWVMKVKRNEDGSVDRYKARLVAQGYSQTKGTDYDEVFSPVARHTSLRTLLALANAHNLEVHQMDVKTAFLNGEIDCDIYMSQPEGFIDPNKPEHVCKLKKSLYGLKQSARCWNDTLDRYLMSTGYRKSDADSCLYVKSIKKDDGRISFVILGVYVDDIVPVSNDTEMLNNEKESLCRRFDMDDRGEVHYLLGMLIKRDRAAKTLSISQRSYTEKILKRFGMEASKPVGTPLEPGKKFQKFTEDDERFDTQTYQQAIGCLTYLSVISRPDIAAAVGTLSQYMSEPSKEHWMGVKRILRYLKKTLNFGLKYSAGKMELIGYSDSDWAGDIDTRRSTSGYVFQVGNGTISWSSRKQATVAKSSTEAEYVALSMAAQEAIWLNRLMSDLGQNMDDPIVIFEDNQGAIELAKNPKYHNRTKHIDICHHFIRERVMSNEIKVMYCNTKCMIADIMTKALPKPSFEKLRSLLGVFVV